MVYPQIAPLLLYTMPQISPLLPHSMPPNGPIVVPYYAPKCPHYYLMVWPPKCPHCCPILRVYPKYPHCYSILCPQMPSLLLYTIPPNIFIVALYYAPKWPYYYLMIWPPKCPHCCPILCPKYPQYCSILCPQMPLLLPYGMAP